MRVDRGRLQAFVTDVFVSAGLAAEDAAIVADVLVRTEARGIYSHGVSMIPSYLAHLEQGGAKARPDVRVVREDAISAVVDADGALGQVAAFKATELLIAKARVHALALVLVRNGNHFGAAGYYAAKCADAGLIGIATSNVPPVMAAPGGRGRLIGNQPLAYAAPSSDGRHVMMDVALSVVAGRKVMLAMDRGAPIPEGWLVDADGRPTTDAANYFSGALMPVGSHKGYGLAVLVEILTGVLAGAGVAGEVTSFIRFPERAMNAGYALVAINPSAFIAPEEFDVRLRALVRYLTGSPAAAGSDGVLAPGALEHAAEARSAADGIELPAEIADRLRDVARARGLADALEGAAVHA